MSEEKKSAGAQAPKHAFVPHSIDSVVTERDRYSYFGILVEEIAASLFVDLRQCCLHDLTFSDISSKEKLEKELQARFELWANTWIAPKLRAIIHKARRERIARKERTKKT